jgi:phenylalanyl-tRNA synthetase alpha chain
MPENLDRLKVEALAFIDQAANTRQLEEARVRILGRKGQLTQQLRALKDLSETERRHFGAALNALKDELAARLEARQLELAASSVGSGPAVDLTLPGRPRTELGTLHPLKVVLEEICAVFYGLGFSRSEGPEVELDYYNFTALNFPDDHPARDIQDTFYISDKVCLRTQTSPVQVRTMERVKPPLAYVFPGRVYRNENSDASHSSEFYQLEGLCVDRDVSLADLREIVGLFVQGFFGEARETRFRPHYFPFTEPSVEVDMVCVKCGGKGCGVCGQTGWLEIMGAGMVHPRVFAAVGYPVDAYTGYAFGMGIDRIAMLRYGIDDIRLLYENDLRFLDQFRGVL